MWGIGRKRQQVLDEARAHQQKEQQAAVERLIAAHKEDWASPPGGEDSPSSNYHRSH